jgi:serpin B
MRAVAIGLAALGSLVLMAWGRGAGAPPSDAEQAVRGVNAFGMDLYAKLGRQRTNTFFSPASISSALGMTYAGARGSTADEMAAILHFPPGQQGLHTSLGALLHNLGGAGQKRGYQLSIANALWAQQGYSFLPDYLERTRLNYQAGLNEVDFASAPESARNTINAWVEKHTQEKIKDLLPRGAVDSESRLVLTNAIYFKGTWAAPFNKRPTGPAPFQISTEKNASVPLMHQTGTFGYLDGGTFQALELQYEGNELAMVVFLPKQVDGLAAFETQLSSDQLASWIGKLRGEEVQVSLPRFKMSCEFSLKDTLSALGMPMAFSPRADFSGMDVKKDLFLSEVFHKAYVDVNEEGTEAAAATGAVMARVRAVRNTVTFRADHPFVFLIRERRSGAILFLGRLEDPQGS